MAYSAESIGAQRRVRGVRVDDETRDDCGERFLDKIYQGLMDSPDDRHGVHRFMDHLFASLRDRQEKLDAESWQALVQRCRRHPIRGLLHEDPFTSRAFSKPRGYAGDAVLMDYLYGREECWPAPDATRIGRHVFDYTTTAPAAEGVRVRRGVVADYIDNLANQKRRPEVLSIAAGHLREAAISAAIKRRKFGRYVALDADATSLREIAECYGNYGIEAVHSRFRELITNQLDLGTFDCVYTTGLFDYLAEATGKRLVRTMFELLKPGGVLIVANFLQGIRDVGYMEAFMDWTLVYRSRTEMMALTAEISEARIDHIRVFAEDHQNIIFMEVTKR